MDPTISLPLFRVSVTKYINIFTRFTIWDHHDILKTHVADERIQNVFTEWVKSLIEMKMKTAEPEIITVLGGGSGGISLKGVMHIFFQNVEGATRLNQLPKELSFVLIKIWRNIVCVFIEIETTFHCTLNIIYYAF